MIKRMAESAIDLSELDEKENEKIVFMNIVTDCRMEPYITRSGRQSTEKLMKKLKTYASRLLPVLWTRSTRTFVPIRTKSNMPFNWKNFFSPFCVNIISVMIVKMIDPIV